MIQHQMSNNWKKNQNFSMKDQKTLIKKSQNIKILWKKIKKIILKIQIKIIMKFINKMKSIKKKKIMKMKNRLMRNCKILKNKFKCLIIKQKKEKIKLIK